MLRDIHIALVFLTRLPWPNLKESKPLAQVAWAFPLVGWLIGGLAGLSFIGLGYLGFNPTIALILVIALEIRISGALHEDGLADVADGLGGGYDKEQKLAIMKDSRIGSFGTIALIISLLLRFQILSNLENVFMALIYAHGFSRALMLPVMYFLPPARNNGLAKDAGHPASHQMLVALFLGMVPGLLGFSPYLAACSLLLALVALLFLKHLFWRHLEGQSGDCLGAVQQITYIAMILGLSLNVGE